jgi:hypothetical protein
MQQNAIEKFLGRMNNNVFFGILFLYQLLFIFQGFELGDGGFHATFYQQIFNDPESVQYGFPFWFCGMIGGAWNFLFHSLGLIGIRLAGVLMVTFTAIVSFNLLKNYLNNAYLKIGLILVVIFLSNDPKELYYNNVSPLLYVLAGLFLFRGLKNNNLLQLFLCGVFLTLNIFARLPNLIGLGLALAVFYNGYINKLTIRQQFRQFFVLAGGVAFTAIFVILVMKLLNHFDLFVNSIKILMNMSEPGKKSPYDAKVLLKIYAVSYMKSIIYSIMAGILVIVIANILDWIRKKMPRTTWIPTLMGLGVALCVMALLLWKGKFIPLYLYTGTTMLVSLVILLGKRDNNIKLLTFIGIAFSFAFPIGSFLGILTAGYFSFWLILPIVLDHLFSIEAVETSLISVRDKQPFRAPLRVNSSHLYGARKIITIVFFIFSLYMAVDYPFLDASSNRVNMHYKVNSKLLPGIYTSKVRAASINELLGETSKYVKPNDYLICYHLIPMVHYLTETRPYIRNPYTGMYNATIFKNELGKAVERYKVLPVVVSQKINTLAAVNWPKRPLRYNTDTPLENTDRDAFLVEFLKSNNYREAWSNDDFVLFVPPGK